MKEPYAIALSLVARKCYHSLELTKKLKEKGLEEDKIVPVIQRLIQDGYLDDESWESRFIEGFAHKGKGAHLLAASLHPRGLLSLLPKLRKVLLTKEEETLERLVIKHQGIEKNRLIQRLQRKGFNLDSILQIVKQSSDVL